MSTGEIVVISLVLCIAVGFLFELWSKRKK